MHSILMIEMKDLCLFQNFQNMRWGFFEKFGVMNILIYHKD